MANEGATMAHDDRFQLPGLDRLGESHTSMEDLIGPGLRLAFPLPPESCAADDRFGPLLEALAQRCRRPI